MPRTRVTLVLPFFAFLVPATVAGQASPVPVKLRAAVVDENSTVHALPQVAFLLIGPRGDTTRVATDLDGLATAMLPPGRYRLVSDSAGARFQGNRYRWALAFDAAPGMHAVELTQQNALVEKIAAVPAPPAAAGGRRVSEEARIYEAAKSGVFTVAGAQGHGSGFLVDASGIVLTNSHVVKDVEPDQVRVWTDERTAVRGRILVLDKDHDVAAIAINPAVCSACAVLPLANGRDAPLAVEGERVLAIGSPLNQRRILTIGIVSKVEPRALISDVNINHGNSGGPLLNLDGQVIAMNTFGDFTEQGGPGISGSVLITQAEAALAAARDSLARADYVPPSADRLPVLSATPFPVEGVKLAAAMPKMDLKPYTFEGGPFVVSVMTPPVMAYRQAQALKALTGRREKREQKGGVTENEKVDNIQNWFGWEEYVGERKAAVVLQVEPKVGQTGGSLFANLLGAVAAGYSGTYFVPHEVLEFKGDFRRMKLLRDGQVVEAVEENRIPAVLNIADYYRSGRDFAYQGVYVYRPDEFAPRPDGTFPSFQLQVINTGKPNQPVYIPLPEKTVRALWDDFATYRLAVSEPACAQDPNGQECAIAMTRAAEAGGVRLADDANLLDAPSGWGNVVGRLARGTAVVVLRQDGKYTYVRAGNTTGYVETKKLVRTLSR
ncbi:MAG: trypsin-like peptidase domain-containing protein [Gemmatimonadetes bacterium]|nr:trypsin-like peptidase domain-containing protein [Gemmatimonadota bacterium]